MIPPVCLPPVAVLELRNLSKTYARDIRGVADLSVTIPDGELVVLVGPSGCGKSTTLRLIAGLETPTSGDILIDGHSVTTTPTAARDVAMVFQDSSLYPHMTAADNIGFGLRNRRVPRTEVVGRTREVAEILGITSLLERRPDALSGGEQQRVALARALVRRPAVCLLDEPLSNLEQRLRHLIRAEIRDVQRRLGTTTISVTHDHEEAMTLGDRLVVMNNGEIQQVGTPVDVYERPANRFVAGFVGTRPMNFLTGKLVQEASSAEFREGDNGWRLPLKPRDIAPRRVIAGVRPQDVRMQADARCTMDIRIVEHLGDRTIAHGRTGGGQEITLQCPPASVAAGDSVGIEIDADRVHLFDADGVGARL